MARTKSEARSQADKIVDRWVTGTFLTGWIPGSTVFSAAGDTIMIRQVADCFGVPVLDMNSVKSQLGGLIASTVGGMVAAETMGVVPVIGWAAKSVILSGKAFAIGQTVIDYFEERSPLP